MEVTVLSLVDQLKGIADNINCTSLRRVTKVNDAVGGVYACWAPQKDRDSYILPR